MTRLEALQLALRVLRAHQADARAAGATAARQGQPEAAGWIRAADRLAEAHEALRGLAVLLAGNPAIGPVLDQLVGLAGAGAGSAESLKSWAPGADEVSTAPDREPRAGRPRT